jgi:hypothetical protein
VGITTKSEGYGKIVFRPVTLAPFERMTLSIDGTSTSLHAHRETMNVFGWESTFFVWG